MREYKPRIVDEILKDKLEAKGAVVIEGPKWCGKTTTAMQIARSVLRMDEPSKRETNIQMSEIAPERLLKGDTPRLIDGKLLQNCGTLQGTRWIQEVRRGNLF